jgi:hypothetical protein
MGWNGRTNTRAKARQETTAHPIIRRCEFAPNWRISARMTLNVPDRREANIRRQRGSMGVESLATVSNGGCFNR